MASHLCAVIDEEVDKGIYYTLEVSWYNPFYRKLHDKYIHVKQYFRKKRCFLRNLQNTLQGAVDYFCRGLGRLTPKISINIFITN